MYVPASNGDLQGKFIYQKTFYILYEISNFSQIKNIHLNLNHPSEFFMSAVKYLGPIVSEEGVKTDAENTVQHKSWPIPKNIKYLRLFCISHIITGVLSTFMQELFTL